MISYLIKRGRLYYGRVRLDNQIRTQTVPFRTMDKQVAQKRLNDCVRERQQEAEGIIPPKIMRDAAGRELGKHLADYLADLTAKQRAPRYVYLTELRINKLARECGWKLIRDITMDSFIHWRAGQGMAPKTLNEYRDTMCAFMEWLKRTGRVNDNPLQNADRVEVRGKERVKRRALTDDEAIRLLQVAGPRIAVYLFALQTGVRRGEMFALWWADVEIDKEPFSVRVRASISKNHEERIIALKPGIVSLLKAMRPLDHDTEERIFKGLMPEMDRYKKDLALAGIPYKDKEGRQSDFHALRHTYCTNLARADVNPWLAMKLMRHSDINLTTKIYTDVGKLPLEEAMNRLPSYTEPLSHILSQSLVRDGQNGSFAVTKKIAAYHEQTPVDIAQGHDVASLVTVDMVARPAGFEPATL